MTRAAVGGALVVLAARATALRAGVDRGADAPGLDVHAELRLRGDLRRQRDAVRNGTADEQQQRSDLASITPQADLRSLRPQAHVLDAGLHAAASSTTKRSRSLNRWDQRAKFELQPPGDRAAELGRAGHRWRHADDRRARARRHPVQPYRRDDRRRARRRGLRARTRARLGSQLAELSAGDVRSARRTAALSCAAAASFESITTTGAASERPPRHSAATTACRRALRSTISSRSTFHGSARRRSTTSCRRSGRSTAAPASTTSAGDAD